MNAYVGMVTSDWSQCLSPTGPFDAFVFHYPDIQSQLDRIFKSYTSNEISLSRAVEQVIKILPAPLTIGQMDGYMSGRFEAYRGVRDLIRWCRDHRILFMINTTGFMAYFQRAFARGLLPPITALSAQSIFRFEKSQYDPHDMVELSEIEDKAANSAAIAQQFKIAPEKIVIIGDSGGDGPHFQWGAEIGATLVGSMTKPSLGNFCREKGIQIHCQFGHAYASGEKISIEKERQFDFQDLSIVISDVLGLTYCS